MACVGGHGAGRGRGRRPRRPACPWASPMSFRGRGAPGTSRRTRCAHGVRVRTWRACAARRACADMARCVVGADVPGGPRARGRPRCRSVGNGAPRTSRPTRCAHGVRVRRAVCVCGCGAVRGRGRRPRRPASPWAFPMSFRGRPVGAARRGRRALPGARMACVCGTRCACADVACVCGRGAVRGRGRRPRRPARPVGVCDGVLVGNGAPRTSRPTMGVWCGTW